MRSRARYQSESNWRVSKEIPVGLIVTIVLQTVAVAWWGSQLSTRVDVLEQSSRTAAPQAERLAKIETKLEVVVENFREINSTLKAIDRRWQTARK